MNEQTVFEQQSISIVKSSWYTYFRDASQGLSDTNPSTLTDTRIKKSAQNSEHLKQFKACYQSILEYTRKKQEPYVEVIDQWYEVQPVDEDICLVYGVVSLQEKDAANRKMVYTSMDVRFTVTCRRAGTSVRITNVHYSIANVETDAENYGTDQDEAKQNKMTPDMVSQVEQDALTGLYNRMMMIRSIRRQLADLSEGGMAALFMVDIDNFKQINDTMGHRFGDAALQELSNRISQVFGDQDIKGRLGGDEFMIYLGNVYNEQMVLQKAEQLCIALNQTCTINELTCRVSCSVGIVFIPKDGRDFEELYEKADIALYHAKKIGKNQYVIYGQQLLALRDKEQSDIVITELEEESLKPDDDKKINQETVVSKKMIRPTPKLWRLFCVGIAVIAIACASYLHYMKNMTKEDSKHHMREISDQVAYNVRGQLDGFLSLLFGEARRIEGSSFEREEEYLNQKSMLSVEDGFSVAGLLDERGNWYYKGTSKPLTIAADLTAQFKTEKGAVSGIETVDGEACILFAVPVLDVSISDIPCVAFVAAFPLKNWSNQIHLNAFKGKAVSRIVLSDGTFVIRSNDGTDMEQENYFDIFQTAKFEVGNSLQEIQTNMAANRAGEVTFSKYQFEQYSTYTPIGFHDWYLVLTVPALAVNHARDTLFINTVVIIIMLFAVFLLMLAILIIVQRQGKKRVWKTAYVDPVTGGANKNKFELEAKVRLNQDYSYTLVYSNILQFKALNDRYGKAEGDIILKRVYELICHDLTKEEYCGRLSADNFAILMNDNSSVSTRERLERLAAKSAVLASSEDSLYGIRMNFGLYHVNDRTEDMTSMLDKANTALKEIPLGSGMLCMEYVQSMFEQIQREKMLLDCIPVALKNQEFFIYLQPKVELENQLIVGAEALARWMHPTEGILFPDEFVPLAERCGLVRGIDLFVFEEVCKILAKWQKMQKPLMPISFNLSRTQLNNPDFLDAYQELIKRYQIPVKYLEFEFTETAMYDDMARLKQSVQRIHTMGGFCAIDDFGSGYSSLGLLGQVQADTLKLDGAFFISADDTENGIRVVKSVVMLANELGMQTVAEGVECKEHIEMLRYFGCDTIQGYVFSRPVPVKKFEELLEENGGYIIPQTVI